MKNKQFRPFNKFFIFLFSLIIISSATAKEKIIKQEKMSFELCLTVITTSENKLSIPPELTYETDQMRTAVFKLVDGSLTITCDGKKGIVMVTTDAD